MADGTTLSTSEVVENPICTGSPIAFSNRIVKDLGVSSDVLIDQVGTNPFSIPFNFVFVVALEKNEGIPVNNLIYGDAVVIGLGVGKGSNSGSVVYSFVG
ncbi:hypothetical protein ACOSQ2_024410 [Xanthoceras sorbifolium]